MAKNRPNNRGTNQRTTTILRGLDGQPILEMGLEELILHQPDGTITFLRKSDNIQLVDGTQWNPGFLTTNPPVFVGVCQQCRTYSVVGLHVRKPTHGITSLARAKLCHNCGTLCCPNHNFLSIFDHHCRCIPCYRKHLITEIFKLIFTRR